MDIDSEHDEEPNDQSEYLSYHKEVWSIFWTYKIIEDKDLQTIYEAIVEKYKLTNVTLQNLVRCINQNMESLSFEIRKARRESDGRIYWGVVNTLNDKISELATQLTSDELNFYKAIIENLVSHHRETNEITLSETEILNLGTSSVKFKPSESEVALHKLIDDLWLEYHGEEGRVGLSVRSFLELKEHFQDDGAYAGFDTGFQ